MDLQIRIRTKMSWIRNAASECDCSVLRLRVCGAGEGGGAVAGQVRRGPALPHQEELGRSHLQAHADIQGNISI
jgi:hypothetical protein